MLERLQFPTELVAAITKHASVASEAKEREQRTAATTQQISEAPKTESERRQKSLKRAKDETEEKAVASSLFAGCFDKPLVLGAYFLLKEQGKGSFGVAYLAVLRRHFAKGDMPSVTEMISKSKQLFIVKRFRAQPDPAEVETIQQGVTLDEFIQRKRLAFQAERQQAAWLRGQIASHPNLVQYLLDFKDLDTGTDAMVFEFCNCGE